MARKNLRRYVLRYTVVAGLPSGVLLLGLAALGGVPVPVGGLVLTGVALVVVPLVIGVTDTGIETASAGAEGGFMAGSDATKYRPAGLPLPDRLAIVCWFSGVGVVGVVALLAFG